MTEKINYRIRKSEAQAFYDELCTALEEEGHSIFFDDGAERNSEDQLAGSDDEVHHVSDWTGYLCFHEACPSGLNIFGALISPETQDGWDHAYYDIGKIYQVWKAQTFQVNVLVPKDKMAEVRSAIEALGLTFSFEAL